MAQGMSTYTANYVYRLTDDFTAKLKKINTAINQHKSMLKGGKNTAENVSRTMQTHFSTIKKSLKNISGKDRLGDIFQGTIKQVQNSLPNIKKGVEQAADDIKDGFIFPTVNGMSIFSEKQKRWTKETEHQVQRMAVSYIRAGMVMSKVGQIATIGLTAPILGGLAIGGKYAADAEQFRLVLETHLKDKAKAQQFEKALTQYARRTPYDLPQARQVFLDIIPYFKDITPAQMLEKFNWMGNMASAFNAPIENIAEVFAKVQAKDQFNALVEKQFTSLGIPIRRYIMEAGNIKDPKKMEDAMRDGLVKAEHFNKALQKMSEGAFSGAMMRRDQTFYGRLSAISDAGHEILGRFTDMIMNTTQLGNKMEWVKSKLNGWLDKMDSSKQKLSAMQVILMGMAVSFGPITMATGTLLDMFGNLTLMAMGMRFAKKGSLLFFINKLLSLMGSVGKISGYIGLLSAAFMGLNYVIGKATGVKPFTAMFDVLKDIGALISTVFSRIVMPAINFIIPEGLKDFFIYLENIITRVIEKIDILFQKIGGKEKIFKAIFTMGLSTVDWKGLNEKVKENFAVVGDYKNSFNANTMGLDGILSSKNQETTIKIVVDDKSGNVKEVKKDGKEFDFQGWSNKGDYLNSSY